MKQSYNNSVFLIVKAWLNIVFISEKGGVFKMNFLLLEFILLKISWL